MLILRHRSDRKFTRLLNDLPSAIERITTGGVGLWRFEKKDPQPASCLSCADEPCRLIAASEKSNLAIDSFSHDRNDEVCPVSAISWDTHLEAPKINREACIACGLCARRCPVGAIGFDEGTAVPIVRTPDPTTQIYRKVDLATNRVAQRDQVDRLPPVSVGAPIRDDEKLIELFSAFGALNENQQKYLVRSALVACGAGALVSRKGDVHTRIDGVFFTMDGVGGPFEVEFGTNSLEASRALLDDVAVLNDRFKLPVTDQEPIMICLSFPRERQGYWQVISDIEKVLKINVHTISIGALLLLAWNGVQITGKLIASLNPNFNSPSIRGVLERKLDRPINLPVGKAGILEPEK